MSTKPSTVQVPKNPNANPYICCWHIITGPADSVFLGRLVFMNYPITGSGLHRLIELLSVTGHDVDFELEDSSQLLGLEFRAIVAIQKGINGWRDKSYIQRHLSLL